MSLESRLQSLITAIGADIKSLTTAKAPLASPVFTGDTRISDGLTYEPAGYTFIGGSTAITADAAVARIHRYGFTAGGTPAVSFQNPVNGRELSLVLYCETTLVPTWATNIWFREGKAPAFPPKTVTMLHFIYDAGFSAWIEQSTRSVAATAAGAATGDYETSGGFQVQAASMGNLTLSGAQTIDERAVVAGDFVLAKDQTTAAELGVYIVQTGAWIRHPKFDTGPEIAGAIVNVQHGYHNGGSSWRFISDGASVIGTTALVVERAVGDRLTDVVTLATTAQVTLSGVQTVDGIATSKTFVLVKNQTNPAENGVYHSHATGPWMRHSSFDTAEKLAGREVRVRSGTENYGTRWRCNFGQGNVLGTDHMGWVKDGSVMTASIADQALGTGAAVIVGTVVDIPPNYSIKARTIYRVQIHLDKTAAGVAAPVVQLKFGTAGTTADATVATVTLGAQTAIADEGRLDITVIFRGPGTLAVPSMSVALTHRLASTGFAVVPADMKYNVGASFNSTPAGSKMSVALTPGAAAAWTIRQASAELVNMQ